MEHEIDKAWEEFNNKKKILEVESYEAILSILSCEINNDELAGFVRGVASLQSSLLADLENKLDKTI